MPEFVTILSLGLIGALVVAIAVFILGFLATTVVSVGAAIADASHERHPERARAARSHNMGRPVLHH